MVTLTPRDADATQGRKLTGSLNSLCDDSDTGLGGERHQGSSKRTTNRVGVDASGERGVELDDRRSDLEEMVEAGVPGSGVVDGDADAAFT